MEDLENLGVSDGLTGTPGATVVVKLEPSSPDTTCWRDEFEKHSRSYTEDSDTYSQPSKRLKNSHERTTRNLNSRDGAPSAPVHRSPTSATYQPEVAHNLAGSYVANSFVLFSERPATSNPDHLSTSAVQSGLGSRSTSSQVRNRHHASPINLIVEIRDTLLYDSPQRKKPLRDAVRTAISRAGLANSTVNASRNLLAQGVAAAATSAPISAAFVLKHEDSTSYDDADSSSDDTDSSFEDTDSKSGGKEPSSREGFPGSMLETPIPIPLAGSHFSAPLVSPVSVRAPAFAAPGTPADQAVGHTAETRKALVQTPIPLPDYARNLTLGPRPAEMVALVPPVRSSLTIQKPNGPEMAATVPPTRSSSTIQKHNATSSICSDFQIPLPPNPVLTWEFVKQFLRNPKHQKAIPKNTYVNKFLNLPRRRDLRWNTPWLVTRPWWDATTKDVTSLLMQITGHYSPEPCKRCRKGMGPYDGCVTGPPFARQETHVMIYSCANCFYRGNQYTCTLAPRLKKEFKERSLDADSKKPKATTYSAAMTNAQESIDSSATSSNSTVSQSRSSGSRTDYSVGSSSTDINGIRELRPRLRSSQAGALETTARLAVEKPPPEKVSPIPVPPIRIYEPTAAGGSSKKLALRTAREAEERSPVVGGSSRASALSTSRRVEERPLGASQMLEMEDWEVGPGFIPGKDDDSNNIAYSNAYLNSQHIIPVADNVSCRIEFVKPGCVTSFRKESKITRTCWVGLGKVNATMDGKTFEIGQGGMLVIKPGASAVVKNRLYNDVSLYITAVVNDY